MKQFANIIDVLNDAQTRKFILEEIANMYAKKDEKHEALAEDMPVFLQDSTQLKRSVWDSLQDKGLLTLPEIGYEYIRIRNKSSELPSNERHIVEAICKNAIVRTFAYYKINQKKESREPSDRLKIISLMVVITLILLGVAFEYFVKQRP